MKTVAKAVEEKATDTKTEEAKTTPAAPVAKETPAEEVKKTTRKTAAKKTTAKKAPARKTAAEKTSAKKETTVKKAEVTQTVHLQFAGKSYTTEELVNSAKDIWKYDLNQKEEDFKKVELYVKPEENAAYYVINDDVKGSFNI